MEIFNNYVDIINQAKLLENDLKKYYSDVEKNEIDSIIVLNCKNRDNKIHLILQSGLHGIEGYVGFALINHFIKKILPSQLESDKNGKNNLQTNFIEEFELSFIINANPYGVENKRRVNENNVDLNRNFLIYEQDFEKITDQYDLIDSVVNPNKRVKNFYLSYLCTLFNILGIVLKIGSSRFKSILLQGQKTNPKGVYYMGSQYQQSTKNLIKIYQSLFDDKKAENTIFIDLHTGYGKAYNMSIVNSSLMTDKSVSENIKTRYTNVVQSNTDSFYSMNGDLIDYIYQKYPKIKFATAFEFGTFGDSILAGLKSVIALVLENQYYFNNLNITKDEKSSLTNSGKLVKQFYEKAYFPKNKKWWIKALNDFETAIKVILNLLTK